MQFGVFKYIYSVVHPSLLPSARALSLPGRSPAAPSRRPPRPPCSLAPRGCPLWTLPTGGLTRRRLPGGPLACARGHARLGRVSGLRFPRPKLWGRARSRHRDAAVRARQRPRFRLAEVASRAAANVRGRVPAATCFRSPWARTWGHCRIV